MTNREILKTSKHLLGEVDRQWLFLLRVESTPVPCLACKRPVNAFEAAGIDLGQVVRDAELLAAAGYDKAGNWDLAQVCGHLTEWMRFPLDGFPRPGLPVRLMLWALRRPVPVAVEDVDAEAHLCALAPPDGQRQQEQYIPQPARLVLADHSGRDRDAALPGRPGRGSSRR